MKPTILRTFALLLLLTVAGVLVAGYHPGAEDDGVYLAAIHHDLNPQLFRADADFFALQLQATVFDKMMAASVKVTHLPVSVVVLAWHLLATFRVLAGCYRIAKRCFAEEYARWCGVALVAVFFTLPVSGTALYIVDQNLHPRAIATAMVLLAIDLVLGRRYVWGFVLAAAAMAFHPIMAAFGLSMCFFLSLPATSTVHAESRKSSVGATMAVFAMPMGWIFEPTSPAWRQAADTRTYYFLTRWEWYEWLGAIAPVFILLWFAWIGRKRGQETLARLGTRAAWYAVFQLAVALVMALPAKFERLRPMQPMRYLHLIYVLMILLGGCLLAETVLKTVKWRWVALFAPAALGMFLGQRALYPDSPHLELPGVHASNAWLRSFEWIRKNTPEDAYFALGADYLHRPGEDAHGFRALALRSALADKNKDSAVVTQVPRLAARWQREVAAQGDWQHVTLADVKRLKAEFGVNWVLLERPLELGLECPYRNEKVEVCRVE